MKKVLARVVETLPESVQNQIRNRYWQVKSTLHYPLSGAV